MKTDKKIIPKIKFGIAYFIDEQLKYRNMTLDLFINKINLSKNEYSIIVSSSETIPFSFAEKLSNEFSTSVEYWINIDKNYKKWLNDLSISKT